MAGKFLKGLPSFNKENFSKFNPDEQARTGNSKPVLYIQTKDVEDCQPQVITTDKTNILLRYLRQQLDTKVTQNKRATTSTDSVSKSKIPRLDLDEAEND